MIIDELKNRVLIFDGATGTMLHSLGCGPGDSPEKWGAEHEELLRSVHNGYIEAGADVILTDTLGGTSIKMAKYHLESEAKALNKKLARIAVETARAASKKVYVAGDIGPTGDFMAPLGLRTEKEMYDSFAEQAVILAEEKVDLILVETMMDVREASVAVKAAKESTGLPVIGSVSFNLDKSGYRTLMGDTPEKAVKAMLEAGAFAVGSNCGSVLISVMPDLVREMKDAGAKNILIMPNAGLPVVVDGKTVFPQKPDEMAAGVPAVLEAGANMVGGCCGSTPDHIRAIAAAVKAYGEAHA